MGLDGPWRRSRGDPVQWWRSSWMRHMGRLVTFPPTVHIMNQSGWPELQTANAESQHLWKRAGLGFAVCYALASSFCAWRIKSANSATDIWPTAFVAVAVGVAGVRDFRPVSSSMEPSQFGGMPSARKRICKRILAECSISVAMSSLTSCPRCSTQLVMAASFAFLSRRVFIEKVMVVVMFVVRCWQANRLHYDDNMPRRKLHGR